MTTPHNTDSAPREQLNAAIQNEIKRFEELYLWLEKEMPPHFFEELSKDDIMVIAHSLMGFHLQEYFTDVHLQRLGIVLCADSADADLRILKNYSLYGIKSYQTFVSRTPPPVVGMTANLRIGVIYFTEAVERFETPFPNSSKKELRELVKERNPDVTDDEFDRLISGMNARFLRSMALNRLILALDMFFRAKTRDNCQYEVRYNEDWKQTGAPSMQIVLAWRNTPKYHFLYRLARTIHRHGLVMKRVNATYIDPYSKGSILVMSLGLNGIGGKAAWDTTDIPDFLRELVTLKYFPSFDSIDNELVSKGIVSGNMGNLLRSIVNFVHQALVPIDIHLYSVPHIEEALCRHPELTSLLCLAFKAKFDPNAVNFEAYKKHYETFTTSVQKLDTGSEENDKRRKNVLLQAMNMVHYTLKTNFYRSNYTAISFRLDPKYLDAIPFEREKKFPVLPYAIFFMNGMHFFGFHIRFKDLSRGGLRTVYPQLLEQIEWEKNNVFSECYNLAYTQHKKNKDIPEGGAKGVIFLRPYDRMESEATILRNELQLAEIEGDIIDTKISNFRQDQTTEYLYQAQRAYIESLITIINCEADGTLRAKHIVDYWRRPEYLYLGPDENMHDSMIQWIADFSKKYGYKPGSSFITSKPTFGINHKEYGVTSRGLNVFMDCLLRYLNINPTVDPFTVKMTGGPDGDVAGNQILNLYRHYPKTALLTALTDGSGTIYEPQGLNLAILADLFHEGKPIRHYPAEKLTEGGFLLDRHTNRNPTPLVQQTLLLKKQHGGLVETWLSGSEMNHLYRHNVHRVKTDIFIPAGGRPRTLSQGNVKDYLDETGKPTSRGIVEGANLYLTQHARRFLEERGVLIIKDSSANKTGVICSSFEVLSGLTLGDELFMANKEALVEEILERLSVLAKEEASLLLNTHKATGLYLTEISEQISERINFFTYQLLDYLESLPMPNASEDPLNQAFFNYCLPLLSKRFQHLLLAEIPEHHKKAIVACHIGAQLVYKNGLAWSPSIVDVLPLLLKR